MECAELKRVKRQLTEVTEERDRAWAALAEANDKIDRYCARCSEQTPRRDCNACGLGGVTTGRAFLRDVRTVAQVLYNINLEPLHGLCPWCEGDALACEHTPDCLFALAERIIKRHGWQHLYTKADWSKRVFGGG